jgi:hypothetical protein
MQGSVCKRCTCPVRRDVRGRKQLGEGQRPVPFLTQFLDDLAASPPESITDRMRTVATDGGRRSCGSGSNDTRPALGRSDRALAARRRLWPRRWTWRT